MSNRLNILKKSLEKKKRIFDEKIKNHFDSVREANGQPLNDKRNGAATLRKWEKQNDSIRNAKAEIEKTKKAIEREELKIAACESVNSELPQPILAALESGRITQWRKFPNHFFVVGGGRGRIIWKNSKLLYNHVPERGTLEFKIFAKCFNGLNIELNKTVRNLVSFCTGD